MEFRILGPLEVLADGKPLPTPGHRQRCLLALLLLRANQVVPADVLIDELWPGESTEPGGAALQATVSRLRKALGDGAAQLSTVAPGYRLQVTGDELDVHRFELLVEEAAGVDAATAAQRLREALALWRGPPLADMAYEPFAQAAIGRLDELRLLALERRVEADLELGRHAQLVPELEALVAEHPLREGMRGHLMLALYRTGRQADALEQFKSARRTLVDELGIEPGPALQELERGILRQDASLDLPQQERPRQRSIIAAGFAGRRLEPLLPLVEPLARRANREVILAALIDTPGRLGEAAGGLDALCRPLAAQGIEARAAAFTSAAPGADTARLATEQDVDLILVSAGAELLADVSLADLLRGAPCDVGVLAGEAPAAGPILVPFAGAEHDWSAIELGAWLAGGWEVPLRLAGPAVDGGKDASRLLASASLAVQRALGVAAEPLLVEPGPDGLVEAARETAVAVVGLTDRWQKDGLGPTRSALARSGVPTLLVRRGLRPGGLAPAANLTRFTWSLRAG
ncbi:MAG TPA: AfsR/SARP family transcriptional regulator [Gaiellaceae bacterium]|jgi:DNA-binding SARP family transcriptional activator